MPRLLPTLMPADLELRLLEKGIGDLRLARNTCADCGRTPLTGERLHHYTSGDTVCELCRPRHRGVPDHSELVCHSEQGRTVRLLRAA